MDKIEKFFKKLDTKHREKILDLILKITVLKLDSLNVKKLKNHDGLFRARSGKIRIIFKKEAKHGVVIHIDYRDSVYKKT